MLFQPLIAPVLHHTACRVYSSQTGPCTPALCIPWSPPRPPQESERDSHLVKVRDSCVSSPLSSITEKTESTTMHHNLSYNSFRGINAPLPWTLLENKSDTVGNLG